RLINQRFPSAVPISLDRSCALELVGEHIVSSDTITVINGRILDFFDTAQISDILSLDYPCV
ncbi:hypothetical protein, partial [Ralstonia solanacearum]|uniref:hypothetical protein n=1 Tax=Ralstonia solanacearum TaxID=305 RepID=UPI001A8F1062